MGIVGLKVRNCDLLTLRLGMIMKIFVFVRFFLNAIFVYYRIFENMIAVIIKVPF